MKMNNQLNPGLIVFLLALLGVNGAVEYQDKCSTIGGIVLGSLVGILFSPNKLPTTLLSGLGAFTVILYVLN